MSTENQPEEEVFEAENLPAFVCEASIFEDPFAPKTNVLARNAIYPAIKMLEVRKSIASTKVRPIVQPILRANAQITSIKYFPFSDAFVIGTLNAIYSVTESLKQDVAVYFDQNENIVINLLDVHPSEAFVACNSPSSSVRIVSLGTGSTVYECNKHKRTVSAVFFAPSFNRVCSAALDGTFIMSDLVKKRQCYCYDVFKDESPISTASMRHDETVIAFGFANGNVGIFDHRTSGQMTTLKAHSNWVNSVDFCVSSCNFATCGIDRTFKIWDLRRLEQPAFNESQLESSLKRVFFLNDGTFHTVAINGCISKWSICEGATCSLKVKQCDIVACDAATDTNKIMLSGEDMVLSSFNF